MSTFEHKNSLRTIEAQIMQKLKNNEAQPKFTGSYKKKRVWEETLAKCKQNCCWSTKPPKLEEQSYNWHFVLKRSQTYIH